MIRRLVVLDFGFSSVRQLFAAMPAEVEVVALTPVSPGRSPREILHNFRTVRKNEFRSTNCHERRFMIPGWSRFYNASSAIVDKRLRRVLGSPEDTAIVYIFPQYASVAERHSDYLQIYFAIDPYEHYEWDTGNVQRWEKTLHETCHSSLAVSSRLCDDFAKAGAKNVSKIPNAVADYFLNDSTAEQFRPANLPPADRLLVGCTGNINDTYDWEFISELAYACPDVDFVFVGPLYESDPAKIQHIRGVLSRPNIRHVGPCSHQDLPRYLKHFDVCLNPLRTNEHNHRRSPLRLYDYLASGHYILSTDIAEAADHEPFIKIVRNSNDAADFLHGINKGDVPAHRHDMRNYISQQTWHHRAKEFLRHVHVLNQTRTNTAPTAIHA